jgi:molybdate transport system substrate-binding protein
VHIANVFQQLGITEEMKSRLKLNAGGFNAQFVARGEADMAVQLTHEIRAVPGIAFIPLPKEFQRTFVFSGALGTGSNEPAAKRMLDFLAGPEAASVIRARHLDLPAGR